MRALIVGGAGRMGIWLARYLARRGHQVAIYDIDQRKARLVSKRLRVRMARAEPISGYDAVLLSIPARFMASAISEYARLMKRGQILAEISSTKTGLRGPLRMAAARGLQVLSLHPFFGPAMPLEAEAPLALIPVRSCDRELRLAQELFPTLRILPLNEKEHERLAALSIWASYLACLSLSLLDIPLTLKALRLAPPRFRLLFTLGLSSLAEEPRLYGDIRALNPFAGKMTRRLLRLLRDIDEAMEAGGEAAMERIRSAMELLPRGLVLASHRRVLRLSRELPELARLMEKAKEATCHEGP